MISNVRAKNLRVEIIKHSYDSKSFPVKTEICAQYNLNKWFGEHPNCIVHGIETIQSNTDNKIFFVVFYEEVEEGCFVQNSTPTIFDPINDTTIKNTSVKEKLGTKVY